MNASRPFACTQTAPATLALTLAMIALAAILGALFFQFIVGLHPCPLCFKQRIGYYIALPVALLITWTARRPGWAVATIAGFALIATAMAANGALGVYHSGVEWHLWKGPADCAGTVGDFGAGNLLEGLKEKPVSVVRCDEAPWRFLGLSLAGYNVLLSALMVLLAFCGIKQARVARSPDAPRDRA